MEGMGTDLAAHFTAGAAVVYIIEWLKKAPGFRFLDAHRGKLNRIVSAVVSLVIALGVTATGNAETGWTISIPPLAALTGFGWEWAQQFFSQQLIYDIALADKQPAPAAPPPSGEGYDPYTRPPIQYDSDDPRRLP